MSDFSEIGLDMDDLSIDLSDIFSEGELSNEKVDLTSIPVQPISLTYANREYIMYTTDSVGIAQLFNEDETLDELAEGKTYLLPEGKEIKNRKLFDKFQKEDETYVEEQIVKQSRVEEFSNRFLRNHLLYVFKKKVY